MALDLTLRAWSRLTFGSLRVEQLEVSTQTRFGSPNQSEIEFRDYLRSLGEVAEDDETLYQAFDVLYDYDIFKEFKAAVEDASNVEAYINALNAQRKRHGNNLKLHFLENHDQDRIASMLSKKRHLNWIKFMYMIYGVNFIYAGEEFGLKHKPDLFNKDPLDLSVIDREVHQAYLDAVALKKEMASLDVEVMKINYIGHGQVELILNKEYRGQNKYMIDLS